MDAGTQSFQRRWLVPIVLLSTAAFVVFWGAYAFDYFYGGKVYATPDRPAAGGPVDHYLRYDPGSITDAVSALAGMIAAVFGIVITVVSIIVQLSAGRYAGVARMFMRDRVNIGVMAFYVIACVCGIWMSVSVQHDFVPRATLTGMLLASSAGLLVMAPYFGYVFWFVEPTNIIRRIEREAAATARTGAVGRRARGTWLAPWTLVSPAARAVRIDDAQAAVVAAMEELTDITSNSISGKDKIIASGAVDALRDLALAYIPAKSQAIEGWFVLCQALRKNPDFVAMDPESLADLEQRKTWVEWKVMREYLGIYNDALPSMRDINYLIAINTRYLGEAAARARDPELVRLVFRFMNSYLRATLNARDVRTAYNVLNQYRLLIEAMLAAELHEFVSEGVRHMTYYGHVSFDMKLSFVTETVAYDVSALCQSAHERGSAAELEILDQFLELDRPLRPQGQQGALLGVRKAQVKLGAYYVAHAELEKARRIARDMSGEPRERLLAIRQALEAVTSKDFWEIIDRGRNFEYMPPHQRAALNEFFSWFTEKPEREAQMKEGLLKEGQSREAQGSSPASSSADSRLRSSS
ncbi:MAG TPA: DUF2254 family protein [Polyangiaceae bacterium]|nr:DUF2254 family protein [Polyangiaceae bacterium]